MFTGIVKGIGQISKMEKYEKFLRYAVKFPPDFLENLEEGASVSINGVCQSVVAMEDKNVWFEAIEETLQRTTLKYLTLNQEINLERSTKIGDEIGGHLLSGHIYGMAKIISIQSNIFTFSCEKAWMKYFFSKGYIALDGVSLTLVDVDPQAGRFSVHLIPETLKRTLFGKKVAGDWVNLELDATTQATVETVERLLHNHGLKETCALA